MVKILVALVAALSILNSSGASPGATEKVAALVARATCNGASHSSECTVYVGSLYLYGGPTSVTETVKLIVLLLYSYTICCFGDF